MKREYTLLVIGVMVATFEWVGLTTSFRQTIFTLIGLWLIIIAYQYRSEKMSGKLQINKQIKSDNEQPLPEPTPNLEDKSLAYEREQHIKPRI